MKTVLTFLVAVSVGVPAAVAASPAPVQKVSATQAAPVDGGWPRAYTTSSGAQLVLYEPQIASWDKQKKIVMYAAISYSANGARPALGTLKVEADTKVAQREIGRAHV